MRPQSRKQGLNVLLRSTVQRCGVLLWHQLPGTEAVKQCVSLPLAGQVWGSLSFPLPPSFSVSLSLLLSPTLLREAVLDLVAIQVTILGWISHRLNSVATKLTILHNFKQFFAVYSYQRFKVVFQAEESAARIDISKIKDLCLVPLLKNISFRTCKCMFVSG